MPMRVAELWRHPVKSMQGERLSEAVVEADGVAGDRVWGVLDTATGRILTARRDPPLLLASARLGDGAAGDGDGPEITLPDGTVLAGLGPATDKALSDWLGKPVRLVAAADVEGGAQGEFFEDATDDASPLLQWNMPPGRFVDAYSLLLLTTASLRAAAAAYPAGDWDTRRFRANVVIEADGDGFAEDGWVGRPVHIGGAVVEPAAGCIRCNMVVRPQPGGLGREVDIYKTLARVHNGRFGVWTRVLTPGLVKLEDGVAP